MIPKGSKTGIVCCSNAQPKSNAAKVKQLCDTLSDIGLIPVLAPCIYEKYSVFGGSGKERAQCLTDFYQDEEIKAIFDISGGDIANEILPYLDFDLIADNPKMFWGYSDLTTIMNAIYTKTGNPSVLYQIRNLIYNESVKQITDFSKSVLEDSDDLFSFSYEFLQKDKIEGIVVGGNIRCLLKLAGTEFFPDMEQKILLLESFNGTVAQMVTYLSQLKLMGVFDKIQGIILGTFTQMEKENCRPAMSDLVKQYAGESMPIVRTSEIGHGTDSKAVMIGGKLTVKRTGSGIL